jgi:hypothetical protein
LEPPPRKATPEVQIFLHLLVQHRGHPAHCNPTPAFHVHNRIGTLPLTVSAAWSSPSRQPRQHAIEHIEASGSQVPHRSLNRARATSAPDTTWPGIQEPARLIPRQQRDPGFGCHRYAFDVSSVVHSRSPSRLPLDAITDAFSATLTTPAHSPTQLAVVCDLPLHGRSRRAHLHHRCSTASKAPVFYTGTSFSVLGTPSSANLSNWTLGYSRVIQTSKP